LAILFLNTNTFRGTSPLSQRLFWDRYFSWKDIQMNRLYLNMITFLAISGILLAGCSPQGTSAKLAGTSWMLVSYMNAGNLTPAATGIDTSLIFGSDGQVSGTMGCNRFSGNYEIKGGKLVFSKLASTLMACPEPQMTQEATAYELISGTVRYAIDGSTLTIYDGSGSSVITFSRVK
jgi:heat shock protein HslJ